MKKIILATTLLVVLSTTSFAGGNNADRKLLSDLTAALKTSSQVHWRETDNYNSAAFSFNGKTVFAFYDLSDNSLIGFSIRITTADLPHPATENIAKKYSGWSIVETIMFIDGNGVINYFAHVQKGNKNLALSVAKNGRVGIFSRMPMIIHQ